MGTGRTLRLAVLALVLSASSAAGQEPRRPDLPSGADPNDWEAYYDVGILRLTQKVGRADDALAWASRLDPSRAEPLYARWIAFWVRDITRLERMSRGDRRVRQSPEVRSADSLRLMALRRNPFVHQGLVVMLSDALPGYWREDRESRAWLAYGRGNLPLALDHFGALVRQHPEKHGGLRYERAAAFTNLGRFDSAGVQLDSLLAQLRRSDEKELGEGYESKELLEYARGLLHVQMGELAAGQQSFGRALTENPGFAPAHARLGAVALARGDTATALSEYALAVQVAPDDAVLRIEYARALRSSGRADDAVVEARAAARLAPYYAEAHIVLGSALYETGDLDAARGPLATYLERARRDDTRRARIEQLLATLREGGASP